MLRNGESLYLLLIRRMFTPMKSVHPGRSNMLKIVGVRILELCATDMAVSELCEDYDELMKALREIARDVQDESAHMQSLNELKTLKRALEQELQERLDS